MNTAGNQTKISTWKEGDPVAGRGKGKKAVGVVWPNVNDKKTRGLAQGTREDFIVGLIEFTERIELSEAATKKLLVELKVVLERPGPVVSGRPGGRGGRGEVGGRGAGRWEDFKKRTSFSVPEYPY